MSSRAPIGYLGIAATWLCTNQGCKSFVPGPSVDSTFLYFALRERMDEIRAMGAGATFTEVSKSDLERFEIVLPPIADQRRIAAQLTAQLAAVDRAAALARHRRLILERLRSLIVDGSFRHAATSSRGAYPINALARIQTGYAFKSEWFQSDGIRLLRNANVNHERVDWRDTVYLDPARATNFDAFRLLEGDVVLSLDRPLVSGGIKVARLTSSDIPSLLLQRVARFLLGPDITPEYLYFFLLTSEFTQAISGHDQSLGVPHVSPRQVGVISIPLPPIEDQHHIVAELRERLATLNAMTEATDAELEAVEALPGALLRRAFEQVDDAA